MFLSFAWLASTAPQDAAAPRLETLAQAMALLDKTGYRFVPEREGFGMGKILKDGAEVMVSGYFSSPPHAVPGSPAPLTHLMLSIDVPTARQLPLLRELPVGANPDDERLETTPHLGKTMTISGTVHLVGCAPDKALCDGLDRFWKAGAEAAKAVGARFVAAPERDWSRSRFDDRYVLSAIDDVSMHRLVESWGWRHRPDGQPGYGRSGAGWLQFATVRDRDVVLRESHPGKPEPTRFYATGTLVLPATVDGDAWAERKRKQFADVELSPYGDGRVGAQTSVDLQAGLPLAEVRGRIKRFADALVALERTP